jgi:hypothetical protein
MIPRIRIEPTQPELEKHYTIRPSTVRPGWFTLCRRDNDSPILARATPQECWDDIRESWNLYNLLLTEAESLENEEVSA